MSRFRRPHPARLILVDRRTSIAAVAEQLGYSPSHVSGVLLKRYQATPAFRAALAELLDLPEDRLFDEPPSERSPAYPGNELLGATS